jgi:segregation and condensation protein A
VHEEETVDRSALKLAFILSLTVSYSRGAFISLYFSMSYQVSTDQFRGPIDLLLYLVRRSEIPISTLGLAQLTHEFLEHLEVLKEISIDSVGDFIDVASQLIELKAREVLPRNEMEPLNEDDIQQDPRENLVQRLLLYKQFKDASVLLEEQGTRWRRRYTRMAADLPVRRIEWANQPIEEVHLWDLVSAFGRVLRQSRPLPQENIVIDETPIHLYMQQVHARIVQYRNVSFTDLFEPNLHKSAMIGIFLAVLELTRHHNVVAEQTDLHSEIVLVPGVGFSEVLNVSNIDDYNPHEPSRTDIQIA